MRIYNDIQKKDIVRDISKRSKISYTTYAAIESNNRLIEPKLGEILTEIFNINESQLYENG